MTQLTDQAAPTSTVTGQSEPGGHGSGFVRWFETLSLADDGLVGGKAANLGELVSAGVPVPPGFALTADAFLTALDSAGVREQIRAIFVGADPSSTSDLAERAGRARGLVEPPRSRLTASGC